MAKAVLGSSMRLLLILALVGPGFCQNCPLFTADLLGSTNTASPTGLVSDAFGAISGEPTTITVQVHASNIVCLASGEARNTYSGVSVIVIHTCNGANAPACNGNPTTSQFDFGCISGSQWGASVLGSAESIITTPPTGDFMTTLRNDCGVCISPARSGYEAVTNNEQHCGPCNAACTGMMKCFNALPVGCCDFYENNLCVTSCTSPLLPNSSFDCVQDCPLLTITKGAVSYQPQGTPPHIGTTASYTCNNGYTLNGDRMRTCQDVNNGMWTGSDPSCNIVDCGTLADPPKGQVATSTTTFGSTATYSCNNGYTLSGVTTRNCLADGTWSGTVPTCSSVDCGGLANPGNGQVNTTTTTLGSTATYSCNSGYTLSGSATRNCLADATWSGTVPTCSPVDCGGLATPANGQVMASTTTLGSTAMYHCNDGYTLSGSTTRNCLADGTWSDTVPTCNPVDCGGLAGPPNSQVVTSATTFGSTATYICNNGYTLSGGTTRNCLADGTWSGTVPTCSPVDCGGLANPGNGHVTTTTTTLVSTATYSCNNGYTLSGSTTRNCLADGTWSGNMPTCSPVDCGGLATPANGQVMASATTLGSTATYSCNNGYTLSGVTTRNCLSDATWSDVMPTCSPVDCGGLANPGNGQVATSTTTFGSTATYSCNDGYTLSHSTTRSCQSDGTWSGTEPTCVSCSSQVANCTQCRADVAGHLTCETCLPRYNLQGNDCKLPCDVQFCKTCDDDSSKCMECNVGYEMDASKMCIIGGDGGGGLDTAGLIGIIIGCISGILLLLLLITILVITISIWKRQVDTSSYSIPTDDKFSSHDNPVYIPPDALEEVDSVKIDDEEITVDKNALDSED